MAGCRYNKVGFGSKSKSQSQVVNRSPLVTRQKGFSIALDNQGLPRNLTDLDILESINQSQDDRKALIRRLNNSLGTLNEIERIDKYQRRLSQLYSDGRFGGEMLREAIIELEEEFEPENYYSMYDYIINTSPLLTNDERMFYTKKINDIKMKVGAFK